MFSLFKKPRKPTTAAEDIALCFLNCAEALFKSGIDGSLKAPFEILTLAAALDGGYRLHPDDKSIVREIISKSMSDQNENKIIWENVDILRGRLMRSDSEYAKGLCVAEAFSPTLAAAIRTHQSSQQWTWQDLAADIAMAHDKLLTRSA